MGKFIIIRGPTGVGKTTVANALIAKLGQGYLLTLDEIRSDLFQAYLTCAMKYENIVGEMFFGNSHTTNPSEWLSYFPDEKYEKLSVLLTASLEDCLSGIIKRKHPSHWTLSLDQVRTNYYDFYTKYKPIFRCMIDFPEIEVNNSRTTNPNKVIEEILLQFDQSKGNNIEPLS
jgi:deoxyadenosine/deoxycytidine kinase